MWLDPMVVGISEVVMCHPQIVLSCIRQKRQLWENERSAVSCPYTVAIFSHAANMTLHVQIIPCLFCHVHLSRTGWLSRKNCCIVQHKISFKSMMELFCHNSPVYILAFYLFILPSICDLWANKNLCLSVLFHVWLLSCGDHSLGLSMLSAVCLNKLACTFQFCIRWHVHSNRCALSGSLTRAKDQVIMNGFENQYLGRWFRLCHAQWLYGLAHFY